MYPAAAVLAEMTVNKNPLVETGDPGSILPYYLRESQAERLYDGKKLR